MKDATDEDFREIQEVIDQRGYLVIGSSRVYKIGDRVTRWVHRHRSMVHHPMRVIAVTDRNDLDEQVRIWGSRNPDTRSDYYYRCITD